MAKWFEILSGVHRERGKSYCPDDFNEATGEETQMMDGKFIYSDGDLLKFNIGRVRRFRLLPASEVRDRGLKVPDDYPRQEKKSEKVPTST